MCEAAREGGRMEGRLHPERSEGPSPTGIELRVRRSLASLGMKAPAALPSSYRPFALSPYRPHQPPIHQPLPPQRPADRAGADAEQAEALPAQRRVVAVTAFDGEGQERRSVFRLEPAGGAE